MISKNADELLHIAVKKDTFVIIYELVYEFGANPNCIIDGKPLLFIGGMCAAENLLAADAYPLLKCNDRLFFERDDSGLMRASYNNSWLLKLHQIGINLFKPSKFTGKSLIEAFSPDRVLNFFAHGFLFDYPVAKLTPRFFDV